MRMRRLALLSACLFLLVPAFAVANAASGKGSVKKSWISTSSGGQAAKTFKSTSVKRLYANFTWKKPAKAGQVLAIEWRDPTGKLRARWPSKTLAKDIAGTRLYAWVGSGVVKGVKGTWKAVLTVGGTPISRATFKVVS